jgi:hypothetical protein
MVRPITVVRPQRTLDRYGNALPDWSDAAEVDTHGWIGGQLREEEHGDRISGEVETWRLYVADLAIEIEAGDRVIVDSTDTFEVIGKPLRAWTPRGEHHIEATLKAVIG